MAGNSQFKAHALKKSASAPSRTSLQLGFNKNKGQCLKMYGSLKGGMYKGDGWLRVPGFSARFRSFLFSKLDYWKYVFFCFNYLNSRELKQIDEDPGQLAVGY